MAIMSTVRGGDDDDGCALPEDQVFEMLTRVSLDDLAACRMVSSRWRRLTYEPGFKPLHCRRADIVSGYFLQSMTRNRYHADFVSIHSSSSSSPAAKEKEEEISLGFLPSAHVRIAAEFKIVRFSSSSLPDRLRCEVFDSRRYTWRRSADVALCPYTIHPAAPAVLAHGAVHWLRWPDRRTGKQDVFAFDMKSETWRLIPLPPEVEEVQQEDHRWARKMILAVEGRLCLLVTMEDDDDEEEVVEVWEMANYVYGRWEKKAAVSLKSVQVQEGRAAVIRDLCSSDVAFFDSFCRVMWYDFWRGKRVAEVQVNHMCVQEVFKLESDLVPCDIGSRPWKQPTATCLDDKFN